MARHTPRGSVHALWVVISLSSPNSLTMNYAKSGWAMGPTTNSRKKKKEVGARVSRSKVFYSNSLGFIAKVRQTRLSRFLPKFSRQGSSNVSPRSNNERVSNPNLKGIIVGPQCVLVLNVGEIIRTRGDQESSPDLVTSMLKVFQIDVYDLLDPSATLSFVTPYVAMRFDVLPNVLLEPSSMSTPIGDSVMPKRVYRKCPTSLFYRFTLIDLVELDMLDFDVILGMDWWYLCYTSIDCRTRVVKFQFPNEPILEWKGEILCLKVGLFLVLKLER
uniref:Gag-pol polyprotein n=1 Tax=Solanum tuberosum TaxID=4113 RepID=M1DAF1_SOLTU